MTRQAWILLLFLMISINGLAQLTSEQRIEDSVIGWWSNNQYDHLKPQTDPLGKKKEVVVNKMVEWLKKSYTPVGGLGTTSRYIGKYGYGVNGLVWNVSHDKMWTDAKGNFKPIPEENTKFYMVANKIFGANDLKYLSNDDEWYITMQPDGYADGDQALGHREGSDPRIHPNAYNFTTIVNDMSTVYLAPGNKLPLVPVTIGELLNRSDFVMEKYLKEKRAEKANYWPGNVQAQEDAMKYENEKVEQYRKKIQVLKERYKDSWNQPAYVRDYSFNLYSYETDPDAFKIDAFSQKLKHGYPVYKITKATIEKMQSDQPVWIAVAFPFESQQSGNQLFEMYTALSQNINYEYIYNYFFNPEKVRGMEYRAANEASLKARLDGYRRKNKYDHDAAASTVSLPAGLHFFEDFGKNAAGNEPVSWYYYKAGSKPYTVTSVQGKDGKWLKLGYGRSIKPALLKTMPANFRLECDVATDENFNGRTGGAVQLELTNRDLLPNNDVRGSSKEAKSADIKIRIESGNEADYNNNNYRGILRVDISNAPEPNEENFNKGIRAEYALKEFTGKKNSVHITVELKNGGLNVFVNNKLVIKSSDFKLSYGGTCKLCGVPADLRFSSLLFSNVTNDSDAVGVYISNIKIKEN